MPDLKRNINYTYINPGEKILSESDLLKVTHKEDFYMSKIQTPSRKIPINISWKEDVFNKLCESESQYLAFSLVKLFRIRSKDLMVSEYNKWKRILSVIGKNGYDHKRPISAARKRILKYIKIDSEEFIDFENHINSLLSLRFLEKNLEFYNYTKHFSEEFELNNYLIKI